MEPNLGDVHYTEGHSTQKPRAVTVKLWEAKRKCPKAVPTHFQNHGVWLGPLKCSVKSYVTKPNTKPGDLGTPNAKRWFLKMFKVTMIHLMPRRNSCRLYIHLAFTCSIGPSSVVWSELRPAPPFPPMRDQWSVMVTGTQSCVWSGPYSIWVCVRTCMNESSLK